LFRLAGVAALLAFMLANARPAPAADCPGDCNSDGEVRVEELIAAVNAALRPASVERCPAADVDDSGTVTVDELIAAVERSFSPCPVTSSPTPTVSPTPTPSPTVMVGLGVRRFSIEPGSSPLVLVLAPDMVRSNLPGFDGFLELTAGEPDAKTGRAFVDVTDASEFIAIDLPSQPAALCLRVAREALPVAHAGVLSCGEGFAAGLRVEQDHRVRIVGRCAGGESDGLFCDRDDDCAGGSCFDEADCEEAGGRVEAGGEPHPGFCNGPLVVRREPRSGAPGALLIAREEELGTIGLPVEILMENATPCGDEGAPGMSTEIGLSSAGTLVRVLDRNGVAGQRLEYDAAGESFSCEGWTEENGPGLLVFAGISLDVRALPGIATDLINVFVWDD
jgi:hypothetical protein